MGLFDMFFDNSENNNSTDSVNDINEGSSTNSNNRIFSPIFVKSDTKEINKIFESVKTSSQLAITNMINILTPKMNIKGTIEPHLGNLGTYCNVYLKVPEIFVAINQRASFALQNGYTYESDDPKLVEKVEEWDRRVKFGRVLSNVSRTMQVYGDAYLQPKMNMTSFNHLSPKYMFVVRDGFNVTNYVQMTNTNPNDTTIFKEDEIIHFKNKPVEDMAYGISEIGPRQKNIKRLLIIENDVSNILANQAAPLVHYKVGTDTIPASPEDVADLTEYINNRDAGEDLITSNMVSTTVINSINAGFRPEQYLEYYWMRTYGGLVPLISLGEGGSANKATGRQQGDTFEKELKDHQDDLSSVVDELIIPKIVGEKGKVWIVFNEMDQEDLLVRDTRFEVLTKGGVPPSVALRMVGLKKWSEEVKAAKEELDKANIDQTNVGGLQQNPKRKSFGIGPMDTDTKKD